MEPLLPSQKPQRGGRWADHRTVINGVFWRTRCGLPWRDVPPNYGPWKTVYNRHRRWSADGIWDEVLDELRRDADVVEGGEWTVGVDAGVVRAHQHAAGARKGGSGNAKNRAESTTSRPTTGLAAPGVG